MKKEFANVIVDISHEKVDRPFGYRIPERLADSVTPGVRVKIPFGAGNALRTGYVIEVTESFGVPAGTDERDRFCASGNKGAVTAVDRAGGVDEAAVRFYDDTGSENCFACEGDRRGKRAKKH